MLGWYDDERLVVRGTDALRVIDVRGGPLVRSVPGSSRLLSAESVWLVPAAGLPAASARHAF